MSEITREQVEAGIAFYSKFLLYIYDWLALGLIGRFVFKCPSYHMLEMYNRYITANHLDIGVGTGYFMDNCKFPSPNPRLALMDLNINSLNVASNRLARYHPEVYQRNVLDPFDIDVPSFDSVGMMNLLHCLPGGITTKEIVFENAKAVLKTGGVVFGSTLLYKKVKHNVLADIFLKLANRAGVMTNMGDDIEVLSKSLSYHFSKSNVQMIGYEALFWAIK